MGKIYNEKKKLVLLSITILSLIATTPSQALFTSDHTNETYSPAHIISPQQPLRLTETHSDVELTVQQNGDTTHVSLSITKYTLEPILIDTTQYYRPLLSEGNRLYKKGDPDLPKLSYSIVVPDTKKMAIHLIESEYETVENTPIAPSKGILLKTVNPESIPYEFSDVYTQNNWYPTQTVSLSEPYILRSYRGQTIHIVPFQYHPQTQQLRWIKHLEFDIIPVGEDDRNCLYRDGFPSVIDATFKDIYTRLFQNFDQLTDGGPSPFYTPVEEQGNMLVITYDAFRDDMTAFIQWKNMKGIPTEMVNVSLFPDENAIKAYIADYYQNHGLTFVLLIGDIDQIPTFWSGGGLSDPSYSYIVGDDHYPDLFVGRFSAETPAEVQTQVERSVEYEKQPQQIVSWYHQGLGIASNEGTGDDGEYDWEHMRNIRTDLMLYFYTLVDELYDGSHGGEDATGNPSDSMVAASVNDGRSIINYCGHGGPTSWSTTYFNTYDVHALVNDNMLPFIWSVACNNGEFDYYQECFGEAWLRATNNGEPTGAIGAFMSSRQQYWSPPMDAQDEMVDILVESYINNRKTTYGALSFNGCMHMNDHYGSSGYDMTDTWILFGDPSLQVRTDTPQPMLVTHDASILEGATSFSVQVHDSFDQPLEDALCALSRNYHLLGYGYTDSTGSATLLLDEPVTAGSDLDLVVTAYNMLPYMTKIPVVSDQLILDGYCYYNDAKTDPVNSVAVHIKNLKTEESWDAETTQNYYELILNPETDVSAGDTLRYFATDDGHYINVTDRVVTQSDIDSGGITLDLILKEYYTDLTDFPYYPTDGTGGYTSEQLTGPACLEMALDYMHWNTSESSTIPRWTNTNIGDHGTIYDDISEKTDGFVNARGLQQYLQTHRPSPYAEYGYNFNIKFTNCSWNENWTRDSILGAICIWTDYSTSYAFGNGHDDVALKPGHQPHVPAFVPGFGDYGRWLAIRGIHTDVKPWIFENPHEAAVDETESDSHANTISVYGYWVNDPFISGIGENTYKTGEEFKETYFVPLDHPGDVYDGEHVAVVEPPVDYSEQGVVPEANTVCWPQPLQSNPPVRHAFEIPRNAQLVKAAVSSIQNLLTLNSDLHAVFEQSYPQHPIRVTTLQDHSRDYFLIPFTTSPSSWRPRGREHSDDCTTLVICMDADTGQFQELSWVETPSSYLKVTLSDAVQHVYDHLLSLGHTRVDTRSFTEYYLYRNYSPFYPDIQVFTPYGTFIVTQENRLIEQ